MASSRRRYEQPYRSKHVIHGTADSLRVEEPAYIKNFTRFVHALYKKQTPFHITVLDFIRPPISLDYRSVNRKQASTSPERATRSPQVTPQQQRPDQQQAGFKTLGAKATKSPAPLSAMPSDFEHIFHYSETQ